MGYRGDIPPGGFAQPGNNPISNVARAFAASRSKIEAPRLVSERQRATAHFAERMSEPLSVGRLELPDQPLTFDELEGFDGNKEIRRKRRTGCFATP